MHTLRKAALTLSSVISPFRHSWLIRSSLDVPELLHAMMLTPLPLLSLRKYALASGVGMGPDR